ncbi:hypothetical protein QYF61_015795, partial [Mycteria americana]
MVGAPEQNEVLQVGSHESGVEGENNLLCPAGLTSFDAAQDAVGFLGCKCTRLGHVELLNEQHQALLLRAALNPFSFHPVIVLGFALTNVQDLALGLVEIHEFHMGPPLKPLRSLWMASRPSSVSAKPHSLVSSANLPWSFDMTLEQVHLKLTVAVDKSTLQQAAFQPLFPKPVVLHGVAVAQVQDLALGLVKPHTIDLSPSIQPVQVPLQSLPTLKQINTPTQFGVICKLAEGALDPFVQIIDKDVKQNWPQHRALGNTACDRAPTGVNSIHHHSLGPAVQPVLYPIFPLLPTIQP